MRLTADSARQLFGEARVARLATVNPRGEPHLVPFTFAVADDEVLHAVDDKPKQSRALRRIANIRANPSVCALADHYAEDWTRLWWVRADGVASVREDPAEVARVAELLAEKYPQYVASPPAGPVLALTVHRWTGWAAQPVTTR